MGLLLVLFFSDFKNSQKSTTMDSIDFDENVKTEKSKAVLHRFRSIGFFFRATEICVALLFVCWIFTCLPFAVKISGEFLRRLACFISTPLFMFFLGNSIVVALLTTKSTVAGRSISETDIYEAFIRSGDNRVNSSDGDLTEEEIIVFDDKQMITTAETDSNSNPTVARVDHESEKDSNSNPTVARVDHESDKDSNSVTDHPTKAYRRSKSEISAKQSIETVTKHSLRRSVTEKCRKIIESCNESPVDEIIPEDHMTNEEFQKTIEAFIAKQLIFRRRESLAVVIHNKI
ncbi:hypothetical protein ISN45_Aa05g019310 [Arabidopsis thaliana x Arabidopsis arenosa]|uniref:Uncharacterized protein n=1 Tax=Arabidopsis thaliana x Arabidopsis arenosa TaxID=1240361 RepID=A0A8T1ZNX5_9BRAS|nr:hypothetical protein ISN45_Aa05g019310 [Arabidopsis thaliana x Arabidopsis arenosa]